MDKHTLLSMGVGIVLGFMSVLVIENFRFVISFVLCVWVLRWLFSQW